MSLEERLRRIEEMLTMILERLERLERLTGTASEEARLSVEIALAFAAPVQEAIAAARMVAEALSRADREMVNDGITKAIVEALAVNGPMTLRGLEREVRRLRGTASRGVIRERLRRLEGLGIVEIDRRGRRMVIRLASDKDASEAGGPDG